MKKILITGADGFIGSHLVEHLVRQGHSVKAFCYYNSFNHAGWLSDSDESVKTDIEFVYGDIRDTEYVRQISKDCSSIIHLASLIAIPYSYQAGRSYIETNITGTLNVLMAAKETGAHVIHTSTSEVYGTAQYVPIDEKHPLNAQSPYAATKIAADQLALSFYSSYDMPVSIVRPFNTFGPRQSIRAIIPTIVSQLIKNGGHLNLGMLSSTRDFTFVEDTVCGVASFLSNEQTIGNVINLGTGFEISIKNLALEIAVILGIEPIFNIEQERCRPAKSEVMRLCSDNSLAKQLLNWKPLYQDLKGLQNGLKKTIDWFLNYKGLTIDHTEPSFVY